MEPVAVRFDRQTRLRVREIQAGDEAPSVKNLELTDRLRETGMQ